MKILFDIYATQPFKGKYHGGGEYAKSVFGKIIKSKNTQVISVFYNPKLWIDPDVEFLIKENKLEVFKINKIQDIESTIKNNKFDRFYSALPYNYYGIDFSSTECIFSIHGLRDIETPSDIYENKYEHGFKKNLEIVYKKTFKKYHCQRKKNKFLNLLNIKSKSKKIIAASNYTKYSIISHFPFIQDQDIKVIYPPAKANTMSNYKKNISLSSTYNVIPSKYILIISGNRWIKNSYRGLLALDQIFSDFPDIKLKALCLGVDNPNKLLRSIKNKEKFSFHGYVDQNELEIFYKNSFCLLFPSLNEGFGYTPIECMKFGIPVLSSALPSVMDVCGDSLFYFNPYSIKEIKNRLLSIILDKNLWDEYSKKSKEKHKSIYKKQSTDLNDLCSIILKS